MLSPTPAVKILLYRVGFDAQFRRRTQDATMDEDLGIKLEEWMNRRSQHHQFCRQHGRKRRRRKGKPFHHEQRAAMATTTRSDETRRHAKKADKQRTKLRDCERRRKLDEASTFCGDEEKEEYSRSDARACVALVSGRKSVAEIERLVANSKSSEWSLVLKEPRSECRYTLKSCLALCNRKRASAEDALMAAIANLPESLQRLILSSTPFDQPSSTIVPGIYASSGSNTVIIARGMRFVKTRWWDDYWVHDRIINCILDQDRWWFSYLRRMMAADYVFEEDKYALTDYKTNEWDDIVHSFAQKLVGAGDADDNAVFGGSARPFGTHHEINLNNARCMGDFIEWFGMDDVSLCGHDGHFIGRAVRSPLGTFHGISEWALEVTTYPCTEPACDHCEKPYTVIHYLVKRF